MFQPSVQLQQLADALRPALGMAGGAPVTAELVDFAVKRHRCGSLLHHAAVCNGGAGTSPDVTAQLQELSRAAARRTLRQTATAKRLGRALAAHDIGFAEFKGGGLGQLLYGQDTRRDSKDVDVLVDPARMADALEIVRELGFTRPGGKTIDVDRALGLLRFTKEIEVFDPQYRTMVEVHARSMRELPAGWDDAKLRNTPLDLQNRHYVIYLVLHGCATRWSRMKWLADFARLVALVDRDTRTGVIALAREYECSAPIVASCELARSLWQDVQVEPWLDDIGNTASKARIARLVRSYGEAITSDAKQPAQQSLWHRLGIAPAIPVYGDRPPPRLPALRNRTGAWFMRALLDR